MTPLSSASEDATATEVKKNLWRRAKAAIASFFDKPWKLPLIVLLAILTAGTPRIVGPFIKGQFQVGIDLQEFKCLPFSLYLFTSGRVGAGEGAGRNIVLEYGRYVSFVPHDNMMGRPDLDGKRIVKVVAGLPGDVLEVTNDVAYINGQRWGDLSLLGSLSASPGAFDRKEVVPDGSVLLLGTTPYSYDGRYYGFVAQSEIKAEAYPIF